MKIKNQLLLDNDRIEIISNGGAPTAIPQKWGQVLDGCDMLIAIPDMHMFLYDSILDNFKFGAEAMQNFLEHLVTIKNRLESKGKRLRVYQLGDLYELRFPNPRTGKQVKSREIRYSHHRYDNIIRLLKQLEFKCVYGNHDYELRLHPEFSLQAQEGKVHLEHGFSADKWYHFANPLLPCWSAAMTVLHGLRKVELGMHSVKRNILKTATPLHTAFGVTTGKEERAEYPDEKQYPSRQLEHYEKMMYDLRSHNQHIPRICIIGHTHKPFLKHDFADGDCFYIDAGAWTDGRSDFAVITNKEVAICRYKRLESSLADQTQYRLNFPTYAPAANRLQAAFAG